MLLIPIFNISSIPLCFAYAVQFACVFASSLFLRLGNPYSCKQFQRLIIFLFHPVQHYGCHLFWNDVAYARCPGAIKISHFLLLLICHFSGHSEVCSDGPSDVVLFPFDGGSNLRICFCSWSFPEELISAGFDLIGSVPPSPPWNRGTCLLSCIRFKAKGQMFVVCGTKTAMSARLRGRQAFNA